MMAANKENNDVSSDSEVHFRINRDNTNSRSDEEDRPVDQQQQVSDADTEPESGSESQVRSDRVNERRRPKRSSETRSVLEGLTGALRDLVSEVKDIRAGQTQLEARIEQVQRTGTAKGPQVQAQTTSSDPRLNTNSPPFVSRNPTDPAPADLNGNSYYYNPRHQGYQYMGDHGRQHFYNRSDDFACSEPYRQRPRDLMKVPAFDGKEEWRVWVTRFETIADRLQLDEDQRLDHLLQRLEGQAATVAFTLLPPAVLHNYRDLKAELSSRFQLVETTKIFEARFTRRNQRHDESVEAYASELKMLYDRAHPQRDRRTREEDLVRRFLDGLQDEEARFEVEFHKEPTTVDEAVFNVATYLQMRGKQDERRYRRPTRRATEKLSEPQFDSSGTRRQWSRDTGGKCFSYSNQQPRQYNEPKDEILTKILKRLDDLESKYDTAKKGKPNRKQDVVCYRCQQKGHFARECPDKCLYGDQVTKVDGDDKSAPLNFQGPALVARGRSQ